MKIKKRKIKDDLRSEYDFFAMKGGVRGKYAKRYREGNNIVFLAPDVAKVFTDSNSVNEALRSLVKIAKLQTRHAH